MMNNNHTNPEPLANEEKINYITTNMGLDRKCAEMIVNNQSAASDSSIRSEKEQQYIDSLILAVTVSDEFMEVFKNHKFHLQDERVRSVLKEVLDGAIECMAKFDFILSKSKLNDKEATIFKEYRDSTIKLIALYKLELESYEK